MKTDDFYDQYISGYYTMSPEDEAFTEIFMEKYQKLFEDLAHDD